MDRQLLIIYHTRTEGTRQMADAVLAGALAEDDGHTTARLLHANNAQPADLLAAHAYVFATPENLAAMTGEMKAFFDRCYYPVLDQLNGRTYATLVCAGNNGSNAARQIARIATGWRLKPVADPLIICTHAQTPEAIAATKHIAEPDLQRCRELGAALATGLALGVF